MELHPGGLRTLKRARDAGRLGEPRQTRVLEGAVQLGYQMLRLTRFHQDRFHPRTIRALMDVCGPVGRHGNDRNATRACLYAKFSGERETITAGQRNIRHDDVGCKLEGLREGVFSRSGLCDAKPAAFQKLSVPFARGRIVLDQQYQRFLLHRAPLWTDTGAGREKVGSTASYRPGSLASTLYVHNSRAGLGTLPPDPNSGAVLRRIWSREIVVRSERSPKSCCDRPLPGWRHPFSQVPRTH
jgi:hypothetical protein